MTLKDSYTKQLGHHKTVTPKSFYTRRLLHQKTLAPNSFYTRRCTTKQLLIAFTPGLLHIVDTIRLLHQTTLAGCTHAISLFGTEEIPYWMTHSQGDQRRVVSAVGNLKITKRMGTGRVRSESRIAMAKFFPEQSPNSFYARRLLPN